MVVLSDFMYFLAHDAIAANEVVDFLSKRPEDVHVIMTGEDPPQLIIDAADMVTDIKDVTVESRQLSPKA